MFTDIEPLQNALDNDNKILDNMLSTFHSENPRMHSFKCKIKTHISLLSQIAQSLSLKFEEISTDTNRYKRGLINGLRSIWKSITGNFDESDGEYYSD